MRCTSCNAEVHDGAKFCPQCGAKMQVSRFCPNCGSELTPGARFCPNCGTACGGNEDSLFGDTFQGGGNEVAVQDDHADDDIFIIARQNFDEAVLGDGYTLLEFVNVATENSNIADVIIDDDGDVFIKAFSRGRVRIGVDFSFVSDRNGEQAEATWIGHFVVGKGNNITFDHGEFVQDEEESSGSSDLGNIIGGIASFAGAVAGGFLQGLAASYDDDDD